MAIDLNSDLGEGVGDNPSELDVDLLAVVSSANVACGGHAGDDESMARVCAIAAENRVAIGAHVSYKDRAGFGRESSGVPREVLKTQLHQQLCALDRHALAAGSAVTYIKPHGELYHAATHESADARVVIAAALAFRDQTGRSLTILGPPGSALLQAAEAAGLVGVAEAFADRRYTANGQLVPRTEPDAVITDPTETLGRLRRLLRDNEIFAIDGSAISVKARSICVHGDTPGAVVMVRRLRAAIDADRVRVAPFAPPPRH